MNQENQLTEQNSEETEIDLLEIFYLLRAKLVWLILAFVIGGVIAGSITHFLITPKYTATAKMYMISASSGSVLDLSDFNIGTSLSQDYTELIKIRPVFNEVIDNLNLDMEYEDLLKKVSISVVGDSRLLAVSVEDNDPKLAQSMVNELVDTAVTYIPKVMNASENAQPTIAEYAVVPDEPSSPNLAKNIILGAVVAMLLVAVIFVVRMLMDDSLNTAEDVEKEFGIMPFTVIPEGDIEEISDEVEKAISKEKKKEKVMEFTPKNRATVQNMPKLPYAVEEALNRLRVNVSFLGSKVKKIMVISSAPDEGKSFIAMQLWRQMAEAGSKSILVDMDLRKSVMVDKYQIVREDNGKILGTSDYLASDDTLDKYVLRTNIGAGDLLPNKENIINPSMLLEGQKLASTFEELDENYRYTFIDAPPLNLVSDGEKIGSLCDGALLVVRAGETPKAMVRNSIRQLERAGCPVVGITLSRAKGAANGYYHKYGNYYGKSYYEKGYGYYGKHGYYGYGTEQK